MLEFKLDNQRLALLLTGVTVVADSQDYLQAHFTFSEDWNDVIKIALFSRDEENIRVALDENDTVVVPYRVLRGGGSFDISVFGNNQQNADNKVITSSVVTIPVRPSGLKDGETFDESEAGLEGGVLHQILGRVQEAQEKVDKAAAWAESDDEVEEGKHSAKHYANSANGDAEAAGRSATAANESKEAAARSAEAAAGSAASAAAAARTAAQDAAAAAAELAAQQTSQSITQTFSALLNAPHFGYDENGHLNFYYGREVG